MDSVKALMRTTVVRSDWARRKFRLSRGHLSGMGYSRQVGIQGGTRCLGDAKILNPCLVVLSLLTKLLLLQGLGSRTHTYIHYVRRYLLLDPIYLSFTIGYL